MINLTRLVFFVFLQLKGIAKYRNQSLAEDNIPINIVVLDRNDNAPYLEPQKGTVKEESKKGKSGPVCCIKQNFTGSV